MSWNNNHGLLKIHESLLLGSRSQIIIIAYTDYKTVSSKKISWLQKINLIPCFLSGHTQVTNLQVCSLGK